MKVISSFRFKLLPYILFAASFIFASINLACKEDSVSPDDEKSYYSISGVISDNQLPYKGLKITIGNASTLTDSSGYFMVDSIISGANRLVIVSDSLMILDSIISISQNTVLKKDVHFNLSRLANSIILNGAVRFEGLGFSGCEVRIDTASKMCNSEGLFEFQNLKMGLHRLFILYNNVHVFDTLLEIKKSQTALIELPVTIKSKLPKFTVSGLITCNNIPLDGALITCNDRITQSDSLGAYSLNDIAFGRHLVQIDRPPFDRIDTVLEITSATSANIKINDSLINENSYFPIKLGKTWRFDTFSAFSAIGTPSTSRSGIVTWKVVALEGTKNLLRYKVVEIECDTTNMWLHRNIFTVQIENADSVSFTYSRMINSMPSILPAKIPLGTSNSPTYLDYYAGERTIKFTKGIGLTNGSDGHYGITLSYYIGYKYVGTDITLPVPFNGNN